jgi:hypothetical protein
MADIEVTDQLDQPIPTIKVDLTQASSLIKYLKTEALHLAVLPDFQAKKDSTLSVAAPKPIQFQAKAQHKFQLGNTKPEIDVTPSGQATIRVNASPGTSLFENDPFHVPAEVPNRTAYLGVGFQGSLDLGVSGSDGDLTFGFDNTSTISLEYLRAFTTGQGEPTLGDALGETLSSFVIPADLSDLNDLREDDIATVSGQGSLKVSGGISVSAAPNPLASVSLPLGEGKIAIKAGATAGLSASFTISGSYQLRARRTDLKTIELSYLQERGTTFKADLTASAGITAKLGGKDLIAAFLGSISTDQTGGDEKLLADLQPVEVKTLSAAIKSGLDHSLQASLDLTLSAITDDQAAFQYEIQPDLLTPAANLAVHKALDGDLSLLTQMEDTMQPGGILAPGIKMLNSVLTKTRQHGVELKVNLLGILNYITVSQLIRKSEIVTDGVSGDVTIKETVTGTNISALVEPARSEALRKVMFDSVLATTTYRAGKAIALPDFDCEQMHFALNQNTNQKIISDYLNWFVALDVLPAERKAATLKAFNDGGPSTCVLRTSLKDPDCQAMFFDEHAQIHTKNDYLEIGRKAMRALLDPNNQAIDELRYKIVDDQLWPSAVAIGANVNLGPLVGLSTSDVRVQYLIGDVMVITDWANGMVRAGTLVQDMRNFVQAADPATLVENNEFKKKRDGLQKNLAAMVQASKTRFHEPWGMVSLYWAAGSPPTAYAKAVTQSRTLELSSAQLGIPAKV